MNNPHDKLFKAAFSEPTVVASLIRDLFPIELAKALDTDSLMLTSSSYIDESLDEYFADLVYECTLADGVVVQLTILLEHKSYTVAHPHLQLLRYLLNRWQQDTEHDRLLTPVIPVIIYHGQAGWKHEPFKTSLSGFHPLIEPYFPEFDYVLVNLSSVPDEQIMTFRSQFLALSAALMKHRHDEQYAEFLRQYVVPLLAQLDESALDQVIPPLFLYAMDTSNLTGRQIVSIFSTASNQTAQKTMTAGEQYRYEARMEALVEGRMKGRVEALAEGNYKIVKGALKLGMDSQTIADTFEIDLADVEAAITRIKEEN